MPCMGPDLDAARRQGNEVGKQLLAALIDEHKLWDISEGDMKGFLWLRGRARDRWLAIKAAFVTAVEELFVEDSCNSF